MKRLLASKKFLFSFILAVILLLIFLHTKGFLVPVERFIYDITVPIQSAFKIISNKTIDFIKVISSIKTLNRDNHTLREENKRLLSVESQIAALKEENEALRKEFGLLPREKYTLEKAFVSSFDPSGIIKAVTINKGWKNGLEEGMPVIVSEGILIGQLKEVGMYSSKVLLIIDDQTRIDAKIQESGARGTIKGKYGLGLSLENIPQDVVIKKGDLVTTSGRSGIFPSDLIIGRIQEVYSGTNEIFQKASVIPEASFSSLKVVSVILKHSL